MRPGAVFRIGFTFTGDNSAAPIGLLSLNGGTFRVPAARPITSSNQSVVSSSGGTAGAIDFSGSTDFGLHLTGAGAGITVTTDTTWTGGGTSRIQNDTAASLDIATNGYTITNGIRLANGTPRPGVPGDRRRDAGPAHRATRPT